ncbi:MAG: EI24 domain-containing protein [Myxococcales bacterium]|nr:EI24 domain-containing protein [Myxococcales bacterium]
MAAIESATGPEAGARPKPPGFFRAFSYPFRGARFVYREHPGLARYWLPPLLLTTAALVAVTWAALHYRADLMQAIWPAEPGGEGLWAWLVGALHGLLQWLLALGLIVAGFVVVALSTSLLAAPFNDALSEAVERIATGRSAPPASLRRFVGDLGRTLRIELVKLAVFLALMLPLLLVSLLVPGVGPLVYTVVGSLLTAYFFAFDYVDWPASRRGLGTRARLRVATRHPMTMLGLGLGVWAFLYVPLLNLLFMPGAVAGGTLLFLELWPDGLDGSDPRGKGEQSRTDARHSGNDEGNP